MASSCPHHIEPTIKEMMQLQPKSILDIGIGFGKWGFLAREYLEAWNLRIYPEQWQIRIDGIEIWPRFVDKIPWAKILYNEIYIGDVSDVISKVGKYDLIIMSHILEHIKKQEAIEVMGKVFSHTKRKLILSLPVDSPICGQAVDGNEHEKHVSTWSVLELRKILPDGFAITEEILSSRDLPMISKVITIIFAREQ